MESGPSTTAPAATDAAPTAGAESGDGTGDGGSEGEGSTGEGEFCGLPTPTLAFEERDTIEIGGSIGWLYPTDLFGDHGTHVVAVNLTEGRVDLLQNHRIVGDFHLDETITGVTDARAAVGDLNGNGSDDLVVSTRDAVEVYVYDGDALVASGPVMLMEEPVWAVAVADFGGTGFGDVAIQNHGMNPIVEFMLGTGTTVEAPSASFAVGRRTTVMIPALMDDDDVVDLVVARTDAAREVSPDAITVMLNRTSGEAFDFETSSAQTDPTPWGIGVADFNGDAINDVVVASQGEGLADETPDTVQLFINDGSGGLEPQTPRTAGDSHGQIAIGDLDCDGLVDVAVTATDGLFVLRGDGEGLRAAEPVLEGGSVPLSVAAGHFTNDDRLDLMVGTADTGEVIFFAAD